jgi:recombinational DNA repair ATPase RecF
MEHTGLLRYRDDLGLITGGPEVRRTFVDTHLF